MAKLTGILLPLAVLLAVGLFFLKLSGHDRSNAHTEKTLAALVNKVGELQEKLETLSAETGRSNVSKYHSETTRQPVDNIDAASLTRKLALLEDEVVTLKAMIEDDIGPRLNSILSQQITTSADDQDTGYMKDEEPASTEEDLLRQARAEKERLNETLGQLDALMLSDEPDPHWSGMMTEKLGDILDRTTGTLNGETPASSYDCTSTLCRVETVASSIEQAEALEEAILENLSNETPQTISTRDNRENGDMTVRFYLFREGINIKDLLGTQP